MPFTTLARVKAALQIPAGITQHDTRLTDAVNVANDYVLRTIHLAGMTAQSYTEAYDIDDDGMTSILLDRMPLQSVTSVVDNGNTLLASSYYSNRRGRLKLAAAGAAFTVGPQKVVVVYVAGFTTSDGLPPEALAGAATDIACAAANRSTNAGLSQNNAGDFSVAIDPSLIPPGAMMALNHFRMPFPRRGNTA
jgi:hypothetical protein